MAMRVHGLAAALALIASAAPAAGVVANARPAPTDPAPPFGAQDLVRLARISGPAASPDGKHVAYTLRTTDMDANRGRTAIWLIDTHKRGTVPRRLTDLGANSSSPEWSGDGSFLYYLSNRSGSMQVWRIAPGGEPRQVTALPLDVGSFHVSPRSDRVFVTVEVFADCATLACTKERLDATEHHAAHGVVYDKVFVRHWDAWSDGRRSQLFSIPLDASGGAGGTPVNLTAGLDGDVPGKPFGGSEDFAISPDGQLAAFSIRAVPEGEPWSTNFDIYVVPAGGGAARNLTADNPAEDEQPAFSPDGTHLAYLASDRPGFESDRLHLVLIDLKTSAKHPLTQNWDRSVASYRWSRDGKTLFATADHLGQHPLWAIDTATGRTAAITGDGDVEGFSVGPKDIFYTQSTLASPADLFSVGFGGGKPRELTRINQEELSARHLGEYHQFNFAGANDDNVFGYVVQPANFKRDQKYPVAFLIHGGPQGSMANVWHWRWNAQVFAGAGYGVVMIDFHGSTGYGQAFTDSISGDWGGKPLEDLKLGLAAALKQFPWLDGSDACALGGSYGGFMVNWIAGEWPDRFKCLVSHDGIFDQRSMYYSTEELWFPEWENGGPEYSNPAGYAKFNPVDLVAKWKTPMLVIHGQLDYRVPYTQGLAVFTALQRRGVPSELLYFPDENHWVLKPENSIQWYDTTIAWLNRWTRR
jgi:dipeptidyl aminopeptidase/acylaminoacyl peptidase